MRALRRNIFLISCVFAVLMMAGIWYVLQNRSSSNLDSGGKLKEQFPGDTENLARAYCSGCHAFPEPELLDKKTWKTQSLPAMGPYLGIFEFKGEEYPLDTSPGLQENFYPKTRALDSLHWKKILDYYESEAPEKLEGTNQEKDIIRDNLYFKPKMPAYRSDANPMASAVRFDPANGLIYLADAALEKLLVFNRNLEMTASFDVPSPVSDIQLTGGADKPGLRGLMITQIGSLAPSDAPEGAVFQGWYDPETGEGDVSSLIIDKLRRPAEALAVDLNLDGHDDLLISEFGHRRGSLFWLKGIDEGYNHEKQLLIETPGCLQAHVTDFTKNGRPDILALCSQVDQAVYLFENSGRGEFLRSTLLRFPVTAGSSSFELVDMNGDGHMDILYTSGDNADYSLVYKPYHGIYLYLNDGSGNFTEKWFYPINGAYSAHAHDFNEDGLRDIAVISFFANYAQKPQEGFVFFKNNGGLSFTPYHPPAASYGRWIAMDVADWSGDGTADIVLANFSLGPTKVLPQIESVLTKSPHLLVLEN